jgi:hypothetical protein
VAPRRTRAVLSGQRSALGAKEHGERQSRVGLELGGCRGRGGERVSTWPLRGIRVQHACGGGGCMGYAWSEGGGVVDSAGTRWRVVTEPPWCHHAHMGTRWTRHAALGCRGPLASGPYRFSEFFKIFPSYKL